VAGRWRAFEVRRRQPGAICLSGHALTGQFSRIAWVPDDIRRERHSGFLFLSAVFAACGTSGAEFGLPERFSHVAFGAMCARVFAPRL